MSWRLKFRLQSQGGAEKKEEEKEKEKEEEKETVSRMCESIGHWPLWGRCPKTGRPWAIRGQRCPLPCLAWL